MDVDALLASVPTPDVEYLNKRIKIARRYTLVFLHKGPVSSDDEVYNERLQLEHLQHC